MIERSTTPLRIAIGGINQETNTFNPLLNDLEGFRRGYLAEGDEILSVFTDTNSEIAGAVFVSKASPGIDIVPVFYAWAAPGGILQQPVLSDFVNRLCRGIQEAMPLDGVLLVLHGALVSEELEDCEGYILKEVRKVIGETTPLVATLDFHAVVTPVMVDAADILVGFRTYPHVDFFQTGERAAGALLKMIATGRRFAPVYRKVPMIVPVENTETSAGAISRALERITELETEKSACTASIFCPHPWLDVEDMGIVILEYAENRATERRCGVVADEIRRYLWKERDSFFHRFPLIDEFLEGFSEVLKPAIAVDSGDICSAGGLGDSTEVLRALLAQAENDIKAVLTVVDRQTVKKAVLAGVGAEADFNIGGDRDFGYNSRTPVRATVSTIVDERLEIKGSSFEGLSLYMGRRACLVVSGITIIVSEFSSFIHDPEVLRSMGVNPEEQDLIVQKSHKLFRAAYKDIAESITILNTPGLTTQDLRCLPYQNVKRPIFPLDEIDQLPE